MGDDGGGHARTLTSVFITLHRLRVMRPIMWISVMVSAPYSSLSAVKRFSLESSEDEKIQPDSQIYNRRRGQTHKTHRNTKNTDLNTQTQVLFLLVFTISPAVVKDLPYLECATPADTGPLRAPQPAGGGSPRNASAPHTPPGYLGQT